MCTVINNVLKRRICSRDRQNDVDLVSAMHKPRAIIKYTVKCKLKSETTKVIGSLTVTAAERYHESNNVVFLL